jgi:hypothetical protein
MRALAMQFPSLGHFFELLFLRSFMWVASLRHSSARSLYSDTLRMMSSPWTLRLTGKLTTVENRSGSGEKTATACHRD